MACVKSFFRIYVRKYRHINSDVPYTEAELIEDYKKMEEKINAFRRMRKDRKYDTTLMYKHRLTDIEYELTVI